MKNKRLTAMLLAFLTIFVLTSCEFTSLRDNVQSFIGSLPAETARPADKNAQLDENGVYDLKDEVALYIHTYKHLPKNYITKKEAEALGWQGGSLLEYAPDKCIGGDKFGNYEGLLPKKQNRVYRECDIATLGKKNRGAKRIIYSNDGLIYYTDDHYKSFKLLYGDENI